MTTLNDAWIEKLDVCLHEGRRAAPRGKTILELDHATVAVDMERCVLTVPERKLSYRGMAAEAYWILSGSDRLADLTPWLPPYAEFSDDGETLWGAYGPRFVKQLDYVVETIRADRDTRRATMALWRPDIYYQTWRSTPRDVPCTVAVDFKVRDGAINAHVFMRSSDLWLGLPYDAFSFSMMACRVAEELNGRSSIRDRDGNEVARFAPIGLGTLWITAASSHLYEKDWDAARAVVEAFVENDAPAPKPVPAWLYDPGARGDGFYDMRKTLRRLRDARRGDLLRWWEP